MILEQILRDVGSFAWWLDVDLTDPHWPEIYDAMLKAQQERERALYEDKLKVANP